MSEKIIGIDLGTATTEAALFTDGQVHMIPNPDQQNITPSAVGLDETGKITVGEQAKASYLLAPERTVIDVKRKIGTGEQIRLGKKTFTPAEISAEILKYVKTYASQHLGEEITRAVISVPAYFDDRQRREVVEAGNLAGFQVERIINEPTAAALSYGLDHMEEESYVLVYDLGGGTFDVTLLEMFEGVLEVKASAGDNQLGGKDFDEALITWLRNRFETTQGISLEGNVYAAAKLKEEAEKCKIALSTQDSVQVQIPMLAEKNGIPAALEETVTREFFEELIGDLIKRTHNPVRRVLEDAGIAKEELDHILLVGGSTRVPLVARDIEALLGKKPDHAIDPDFSVAQGAAIQAGIIAGELDGADALIMTDVCPYTLGIQVWDGITADCMSTIIPRNTTIPVTKKETYWTSWDYQNKTEIAVYQGESRQVSRNHFLGNFMLEGIPERKAGEESIDVEFSYNQNGILDVKATIVSTHKDMAVTIDLMDSGKKKTDVSEWKQSSCAGEYRTVIRRGERFESRCKKNKEDELLVEIQELLYLLKKAILEENTEEADDLADEIRELIELEG